MWVDASSAEVEAATIAEVAVEEAEIRVDREVVQVSPCVRGLDTEQACVMRWGVARVEEFCGTALIECVRKRGTRDPNQLVDSVSRVWDERGVRRQSKGLSRVQ
jgi:hypothetical protein